MNGFYGQNFTQRSLLVVSLIITGMLFSTQGMAQQDKQAKKDLTEELTYLSEASQMISNKKFAEGEANYRKAIAIDQKETTGNYNLGNAYYRNNLTAESKDRFVKAAKNATSKPERHKAFHNLGNTLMQQKDYAGAVEAYKNALRNNPTDDETRYNLALAKELLEKNPPEGGGGDDNKQDQNKDQQDQQDQDNKDKEGDDGDQKEDQDKGEDKEDQKEGDKDEDKGKPDEGKDQEDKQGEQPQQPQPTPGKLSPQEIKNLLESMNNEEKKVQDKINAEKQKGAKVKSEKDW